MRETKLRRYLPGKAKSLFIGAPLEHTHLSPEKRRTPPKDGAFIKRAHNNLPPATIDPYRPRSNLSAATEPYRTYDNLCLTIINPYRACNNLSAITDPWAVHPENTLGKTFQNLL
jgi:hypothetical protein